MSNPLLEEFRANENFRFILAGLVAERPVIPAYNHQQDNTEEWKALSNMLKGYDKCLALLGEFPEGEI